jgi:hypothetical protein
VVHQARQYRGARTSDCLSISQLRREERYSFQKLLHRRSADASNFVVGSGDDENEPLVGLWWKFTQRSGKGFYYALADAMFRAYGELNEVEKIADLNE